MFCFKCGATMPDAATVCAQCGTAVKDAPQVTPPSAPAASGPAQPVSPWLNVPSMQPAQGQPAQPGMQPRPAFQPQTDGKATTSLVLGILSITCFWILAGIPAVIFGHMSRKNIRESRGRLKGDGIALAGLVMGYASPIAGLVPVLIVAAIVIPNLLHSRVAANEAAAMSAVRTINTSEVTYITVYEHEGYARDLARMGPGSGNCTSQDYPSAQHACLLDSTLGGELCAGTNWCTKYGFKFVVTGICDENQPCSGYVVTAVPLKPGTTGTRSFCSTSDAVVRYKFGPPPALPLASAEECASWAPLI